LAAGRGAGITVIGALSIVRQPFSLASAAVRVSVYSTGGPGQRYTTTALAPWAAADAARVASSTETAHTRFMPNKPFRVFDATATSVALWRMQVERDGPRAVPSSPIGEPI